MDGKRGKLSKSPSKKTLDRNNVNAKSLDGLDPFLKKELKHESLKTIPNTIMESPLKPAKLLTKNESKNILGKEANKGYSAKMRINAEQTKLL